MGSLNLLLGGSLPRICFLSANYIVLTPPLICLWTLPWILTHPSVKMDPLVGPVGATLVAIHRLLIAVASLPGEHRLQGVWASVVAASGLQSTGSIVVVHGFSCPKECWGLCGPGVEPTSPALTGGFFTTEPPGKALLLVFILRCSFANLFQGHRIKISGTDQAP